MKSQRLAFALLMTAVLLTGCKPAPDGPVSAAFDGIYKGSGTAVTSGGDCPATMPDDTLTVAAGYATFADLRGWVAPGGTARLSSRIATLQGQFQGRHFSGTLQFHEYGTVRPTCGYTLSLDLSG
ncbi:MAG: hypothetical protein JSS43_29875 [Proteobacteria bacterium]|nr:hypothetical protein [Pseudomonadota bacterium]